MGLFKGILRAVIAVPKALIVFLMIALLALNVATVAIGSVATMVSAAYSTVTGATSVNGQLKKQISKRDKEIATLTDDVARLKKKQIVSYRGQKKLVSEAVEDTTKRVGKRTLRGAGRNVGSMFFEAIPIAGAAVVVGVTAWELSDACETMKDMNELNRAFNSDNVTEADKTHVCGMSVPTLATLKEIAFSRPDKAAEKATEKANEFTAK